MVLCKFRSSLLVLETIKMVSKAINGIRKLLYIVDRLALTYQNHTSIVIDIWYKLLVQCNVNGECAGLKNHKSLLLMRMGAGEAPSLPWRNCYNCVIVTVSLPSVISQNSPWYYTAQVIPHCYFLLLLRRRMQDVLLGTTPRLSTQCHCELVC